MTTYTVNATLKVAAWVTVDADSPDEALEEARLIRPEDWDVDPSTSTLSFNTTPIVEEVAE